MKKQRTGWSSCLVALVLLVCAVLPVAFVVKADDIGDMNYYSLYDEQGNYLSALGLKIQVDDEYISEGNKLYHVTTVDDNARRAAARYVEDVALPEFETASATDLENMIREANNSNDGQKVLLYCSHTDESYVPSDGTESKKNGGGILDVAQAFQSGIEEKGKTAVLDKTNHFPHDAGAYRRSRKTVVDLVKKNGQPAAIVDVHRDAVPAKEYNFQLNGQDATKVRIVLGAKNQNKDVNKQLALKVKSIADKKYPGLVKDIYTGKGEYNQEVSPRALLLEFGSHESKKEAAEVSAKAMADVMQTAVYGGTFQSAGQGSQNNTQTAQPGQVGRTQPQQSGTAQGGKTYKVQPIANEKPANGVSGSVSGMVWLLVVAGVALVAFLFISMGSRERRSKVKNFWKHEFDDVFHRKS